MDEVDDAVAPARGPIRAAGGLVVRDEQVLLVHRPRFDDWSLPKGKLKRGEHPLAGAVREVREETGVLGVPGVRLPTASYDVWSGDALVEKLVDYWVMTVGDIETFVSGDEVDEIGWLSVPEALRILTYPRDVRVLRAYQELPPLAPPVVLLRPLDEQSGPSAEALVALLALLRPGRLIGADSAACRRTLAPLARMLSLEVDIDERFGEATEPAGATAALRGLVGAQTATVVCGQRGLISAVVPVLSQDAARSLSYEAGAVGRIGPGHGLVLSFSGGALVAVDLFTPDVP